MTRCAMWPSLRSGLLLALMTTALFAADHAHATGRDPAAAEKVFAEAIVLLEGGQVDLACERFLASNQLDPSAGALLNLADCRLRQGRTATAWALFAEAANLALAQGKQQHADEARRRASELEPRLSQLTVRVASAVPGLQVTRNGVEVPPAVLGSPMPVDPGKHTIVGRAPGYNEVARDVSVGSHADAQVVVLPALLPTPALTPRDAADGSERKPSADATRQQLRASRATPWIVGGVGAAALVGGSIFGVLALEENAEAEKLCPSRSGCSNQALQAEQRRDRAALIANLGAGVGLAGLLVASWLFLAEPDEEAVTRIEVLPERASVVVSGRF